jgi:hypothetical protein
VDGRVVPARVEAPPLLSVALAKKGKQGAKAPRKTGAQRAPCSSSVRGHGRRSATVVTDRVLAKVEAGASDELPLTIRQSFKDGRYSPSTGMLELG